MLSIKIERTGRIFEEGVIQNHVIEASNRRILKHGLAVARSLTPVRTGEAKEGWRIEAQNTISNDVPHVPYLEYGTRYIAPRRMAAQAAESMEREYSNEISSSLRIL